MNFCQINFQFNRMENKTFTQHNLKFHSFMSYIYGILQICKYLYKHKFNNHFTILETLFFSDKLLRSFFMIYLILTLFTQL